MFRLLKTLIGILLIAVVVILILYLTGILDNKDIGKIVDGTKEFVTHTKEPDASEVPTEVPAENPENTPAPTAKAKEPQIENYKAYENADFGVSFPGDAKEETLEKDILGMKMQIDTASYADANGSYSAMHTELPSVVAASAKAGLADNLFVGLLSQYNLEVTDRFETEVQGKKATAFIANSTKDDSVSKVVLLMDEGNCAWAINTVSDDSKQFDEDFLNSLTLK